MGNIFSFFFKSVHVSSEATNNDLNEAFEKLPKSGELKKAENGFTYIDVDDRFIRNGLMIIKKFGFEEPPYFGDGVGAHITVMDVQEGETVDAEDILGKKVEFELEKFEIVKLKVKEVFLVVVKADVLHQMREGKGLDKVKHPFHITIGTKNI